MENRIHSIDAFRGITMLFIIGLAYFIVKLCALFQGDISNIIAMQMSHVEWDGLRHHDTLFPTFLFIAGLSFPFSYAKSISQNRSRASIYKKIITRAIVLVILGVVYNGFFNFDFEHLRIASVLGRIGLAWMFAAILFINFRVYPRIIIAISILIAYWLVSAFIPAPDASLNADALSMEGCLVGYIDRLLLPGRLYKEIFDPEGLLSTIPAIVTAMLGMFTGEYVRKEDISGNRKSIVMASAGIILFTTGWIWNFIYPINKALWSSSFVIAVGGFSLFFYAIFYYIIDVRKWEKWAFFLEIIGVNSITIYMAREIIDFSSISGFFVGGFASLFSPEISNVITSGGYLLVIWVFLYFLYKQKIFLKV